MMEDSRKLKYLGYSIVFQEVPNEITLAINVSGCPRHCEGCHSTYLWDYAGSYISEDIDEIITQNIDFITCVCFFGGDQNIQELHELLYHIKNQYDLKTCLYSGEDNINSLSELFDTLDYIKIGSYIKELGGLDSPVSNQKMYTIESGSIAADITNNFRKKKR